MYLSHAPESVHVVEDGDALPVAGRVQDVTVDFEVFHHQVHQVGPQLQRNHVGPVGLGPLQRRPRVLLRLQLTPQLAGKEVVLLEKRGSEEKMRVSLYARLCRHCEVKAKNSEMKFFFLCNYNNSWASSIISTTKPACKIPSRKTDT